MDFDKYSFDFGTHNNKDVIWIRFEYSSQLKNELKLRFPSAKWSQTNKAWYLPDFKVIREQLKLPQKSLLPKRFSQIHPVNQPAMKNYVNQLQLKAYSVNTIRIYVSELLHLLLILKHHPVDDLTPQRLKDYFLYCVKQEKMKERKMNGKINAIKFYFEQVLDCPKIFYDIPRPKKPKESPKSLSTEEVIKIFAQVKNEKHLLALKMCYGMGLRVSEVVKVKMEDIDSDRMHVFVKGTKGKKDRYTKLPQSLLPLLESYYKNYKPKEYLLEGKNGGLYSTTTIQTIFKKALYRARIRKKIGLDSLRHSFATHLLEQGTDVGVIQELLGHNSIITTEIYTQVTDKSMLNIVSPLDRL